MSYPIQLENISYAELSAVDEELGNASKHGGFNSLHECYAVLLEEVDELWDITRLKRKDRDQNELRKELVQIAAMAIKGLQCINNFTGGNI